MNIGLIDVDGHNFPNLPLMKISEWHKMHGDHTEMCIPLCRYDICYQSKVFTEEYSPDINWSPMADIVHMGGTGYGLKNELPYEIEHTYPDYSLYGINDTAFGFLSRGCPRGCGFCIVGQKEGLHSRKVADLEEFWNGQKNITLLDPNLLACDHHLELMEQLINSGARIDINQGFDIRLTGDTEIELINRMRLSKIHFAWDNPLDDLEYMFAHYTEKAKQKPKGRYGTVYILTNYGSTFEQNLYRVQVVDALGFDPYVMIYNKPSAPKIVKHFQRWVNNKKLFRSCSWNDYWRNKQ